MNNRYVPYLSFLSSFWEVILLRPGGMHMMYELEFWIDQGRPARCPGNEIKGKGPLILAS